VCDRYIDSTRAYQAGASGLSDDDVMAAHRVGSGGLMPDRTLLFTLPFEVAARRAALRDAGKGDRFGTRDRAFHEQVAAAFQRYAEAEPARFRMIDASATPEEVGAHALAALADMLP
jgi:dTMP kinase